MKRYIIAVKDYKDIIKKGDVLEDVNGQYVKFSDVEKLQADNERLNHELEKTKMDERITKAELYKWVMKYKTLTKGKE